MKTPSKSVIISSAIFGALNLIGTMKAGGDGFFNNTNEAPVGFSFFSFLTALIMGALFGMIPWVKLAKRIMRKK